MELSDIIQVLALVTTIAIFGAAHFISRNRDRVAANREIYQRLELASIELFRFEADHPELVKQLREKDAHVPKKDSAEETVLIDFLCQYLNLFEMAYRLRKEDIVPHDVFGSWVVWFLSLAEAPAFPRLWEEVKCDYVKDLVQVMEKAMELVKQYPDDTIRRREFFQFMSKALGCCPDIANWHGIETNQNLNENSGVIEQEKKEDNPNITIDVRWICTEAEAAEIAGFMQNNITPEYISHGEIMDGRALDENHWNPDLHAVLIRELLESYPQTNAEKKQDRFFHCRIHDENNQLIAIALSEIIRDSALAYASLHDVVIEKNQRNRGIGHRLLEHVETVLREQKIQHIFIESGLHNDKAHRFFEHVGFRQTSTVSRKTLE